MLSVLVHFSRHLGTLQNRCRSILGYLESFVATGQFMEKLLVERVAFFSTACGHENVTSDELMNNLTVSGHTAKSNVDVALKLYGHLGD